MRVSVQARRLAGHCSTYMHIPVQAQRLVGRLFTFLLGSCSSPPISISSSMKYACARRAVPRHAMPASRWPCSSRAPLTLTRSAMRPSDDKLHKQEPAAPLQYSNLYEGAL